MILPVSNVRAILRESSGKRVSRDAAETATLLAIEYVRDLGRCAGARTKKATIMGEDVAK